MSCWWSAAAADGLSRRDRVPGAIDGIRTDVYEVGYLRALATPRDRFRPTMPGGVSLGHYKITAGTLGALVTDRLTGERLILSNNHVLANVNDASAGDPVLQPAPRDGGRNPADVVAHLERFIPLQFIGEPAPVQQPTSRIRPTLDGGKILRLLVNMINLMNELSGSDWRVQTAPAPGSALAAQRAAQASGNNFDAALARPVNQGMFTGEIRGMGRVQGHALAGAWHGRAQDGANHGPDQRQGRVAERHSQRGLWQEDCAIHRPGDYFADEPRR